MSVQQEIEIFWKEITLCLVDFFSESPAEAKRLTTQLRKRMDLLQPAVDFDSFYHEEPIHLAEDLAGQRLEWSKDIEARYAKVREQARSCIVKKSPAAHTAKKQHSGAPQLQHVAG